MKSSFRSAFDQNLNLSLATGLRLMLDFPKSAKSLTSIVGQQAKAHRRRNALEKEGVLVPPLFIVSTTNQCNLHCQGCYAAANCDSCKPEMSRAQMDSFLSQAMDAGCSVMLLAGGEPLLSQDWLEALAGQPSMLGLVFTNGTLFDEKTAGWFSQNRSIIPLFSIEGDAGMTDARRGDGVAERIQQAIKHCQEAHLPFGVSITTGGHNIDVVTAPGFITPYIEMGCRLVIHVEYVPVSETDALLALTDANKACLDAYCSKASNKGAYFIAFPGDDSAYDGCLAAGRGFAHISANGSLEPCPFAPFSDRNVCETSFIEALKSPLLQSIRDNSEQLHEGAGGCALRTKGDWLQGMCSKG